MAWAVVRVVIPPTAARAHETELLLCGHHYRVSRAALAAAHAAVSQLPEHDDPDAWFPGDPRQHAPAPSPRHSSPRGHHGHHGTTPHAVDGVIASDQSPVPVAPFAPCRQIGPVRH